MRFFISFLLCAIFSLQAGNNPDITGKVVDAKTGQPIENVNVYIVNSIRGASTDKDGNYTIENMPAGKYDILFSHVAYFVEQRSVRVGRKAEYTVSLSLKERPLELNQVSVVDEEDNEWKSNYKKFKEALLGQSRFADDVEILNPYQINFGRNDIGNFTASCDVPLEIVNKALGYKIHYRLEHFEISYDYTKYSGISAFDTLKAENEKEKEEWDKNRLEAYAGSLRHFLRALSEAYMQQKQIRLAASNTIDNGQAANDFDVKKYMRKHGFIVQERPNDLWGIYGDGYGTDLHPQDILSDGYFSNELNLSMKDILFVEYEKDYDDQFREREKTVNTQGLRGVFKQSFDKKEEVRNSQISWLRTLVNPVSIDKAGRYYDTFMLYTLGQWSRERVAELLPFEYDVSDEVLFEADFR